MPARRGIVFRIANAAAAWASQPIAINMKPPVSARQGPVRSLPPAVSHRQNRTGDVTTSPAAPKIWPTRAARRPVADSIIVSISRSVHRLGLSRSLFKHPHEQRTHLAVIHRGHERRDFRRCLRQGERSSARCRLARGARVVGHDDAQDAQGYRDQNASSGHRSLSTPLGCGSHRCPRMNRGRCRPLAVSYGGCPKGYRLAHLHPYMTTASRAMDPRGIDPRPHPSR